MPSPLQPGHSGPRTFAAGLWPGKAVVYVEVKAADLSCWKPPNFFLQAGLRAASGTGVPPPGRWYSSAAGVSLVLGALPRLRVDWRSGVSMRTAVTLRYRAVGIVACRVRGTPVNHAGVPVVAGCLKSGAFSVPARWSLWMLAGQPSFTDSGGAAAGAAFVACPRGLDSTRPYAQPASAARAIPGRVYCVRTGSGGTVGAIGWSSVYSGAPGVSLWRALRVPSE
ncbi:hypothetical protein CAN33_000025 [Aspergillus niger]|uniref:Uncharacterized protein n=1 Tax=Aspergillus niger TaxID=5061 RepID=A0A505IE02_ASPNG|nr:hypothetical protein CAN33_000025 [Aspergillus niger]